MPSIADHIFAAVLVLGVPLYAARFEWPRMRHCDADAPPAVRVRIYWGIMGPEWLLAAAAVAVWLGSGRPLAELGFGPPAGWRFWIGAAAAATVAAGIGLQYRLAVRTEAGRAKVLQELRQAAPFAPRTRAEMGPFAALSFTAGVCEEILYRGFLIWYLVQFTGTTLPGLALAIVLSSLFFGAVHLYQGPTGAVRVAGLALVFGTLFVLSDSLWAVIVLHTVVDLAGGWLSVNVHRARRS